MLSQTNNKVRSKQKKLALAVVLQKNPAVARLAGGVNLDLASAVMAEAERPLTAVECCYLLLFMSGASASEIADAMNVETASVYTMKYRLKKKFSRDFLLPF